MTILDTEFLSALANYQDKKQRKKEKKEAKFPAWRVQAIMRHVWKLTDEEIKASLSLHKRRRCTVAEFFEFLDKTHEYRHMLPLARTAEFEVCYLQCSYESICAMDDSASLIMSFRKFRTCPLGFVLVKPWIDGALSIDEVKQYLPTSESE